MPAAAPMPALQQRGGATGAIGRCPAGLGRIADRWRRPDRGDARVGLAHAARSCSTNAGSGAAASGVLSAGGELGRQPGHLGLVAVRHRRPATGRPSPSSASR